MAYEDTTSADQEPQHTGNNSTREATHNYQKQRPSSSTTAGHHAVIDPRAKDSLQPIPPPFQLALPLAPLDDAHPTIGHAPPILRRKEKRSGLLQVPSLGLAARILRLEMRLRVRRVRNTTLSSAYIS